MSTLETMRTLDHQGCLLEVVKEQHGGSQFFFLRIDGVQLMPEDFPRDFVDHRASDPVDAQRITDALLEHGQREVDDIASSRSTRLPGDTWPVYSQFSSLDHPLGARVEAQRALNNRERFSTDWLSGEEGQVWVRSRLRVEGGQVYLDVSANPDYLDPAELFERVTEFVDREELAFENDEWPTYDQMIESGRVGADRAAAVRQAIEGALTAAATGTQPLTADYVNELQWLIPRQEHRLLRLLRFQLQPVEDALAAFMDEALGLPDGTVAPLINLFSLQS
ncbi:hypothetical protein [Deinococcus aestuarii]|uniref:hypothetical protein n=1 Tax=Deinococcus aestuarii TaxID=2774531 RepID=UPI001C0BB216|nr:hypothetical protein [Deinococcus aestuarii]